MKQIKMCEGSWCEDSSLNRYMVRNPQNVIPPQYQHHTSFNPLNHSASRALSPCRKQACAGSECARIPRRRTACCLCIAESRQYLKSIGDPANKSAPENNKITISSPRFNPQPPSTEGGRRWENPNKFF